MSKVVLVGNIIVPEKEISSVRQALPLHIELTRAEEGCLVFEVNEHTDISGRFDVYEEFKDSRSFKSHQKRVKESTWGELTKGSSRNYTIEGLETP